MRLGLDPLADSDLEFTFTQNLEPGQDFLTVKDFEIGSKGTANYYHNGGTLKVLQDLTFGTAADGEGLYYMGTSVDGGNIIWGTLSVGGHETLGLTGQGYLLQSPTPPPPPESINSSGRLPSLGCTPPVTPTPPAGPTHSVGKNLYLGFGAGSDGEINLYNSSLTVGGSTRVGKEGTGLFDQDNSTVKIKGNYYPDPKFVEGTLSSSPDFPALSKKNLKNSKLECVSNQGPGLIVGLENKGYYNLKGGALNVNYSEIIGLGSVGSSEKKVIDGMGYFLQTDGTHTINGNLYLGKEANGYGEFDISTTNPQNQDTSIGLLDVHGFASVGYLGEGWFTQYGGTVKIKGIDQEVNLKGKSLSTTLSKGQSLSCSQHQYIGFTVGRGGTGDYYLDDGELHVSRGEIIGMLPGSKGIFEQFGGNHFIGGNLTIARDKGSLGNYNLYDGMLSANGGVVNNDTFKFFGGLVKGKVTNNGNFMVLIPDPDLNIPNPAARMVSGDFINNKGGVVSVIGTNVTFTKEFQNNGKYECTLSSSKFKNLTIKTDGFIKAGEGIGDYFAVSGNFINESTRKSDWNTQWAEIKFTGAGTHYFKTGGKNFAWGAFSLADKAVVRLQGDLHTGNIDGVNTDNGKITNMYGFCGIGIYYDTINLDFSNDPEKYYILTNIYNKQVGKFTSSGFKTFVNCH